MTTLNHNRVTPTNNTTLFDKRETTLTMQQASVISESNRCENSTQKEIASQKSEGEQWKVFSRNRESY